KVAGVLVDALKIMAPSRASEVAELLPVIRSETSPSNASYLRGKKDGDTFMGHKLLHVVSQSDGEAALERFYDRIRHIVSPSPLQQKEQTLQGSSGRKGMPSSPDGPSDDKDNVAKPKIPDGMITLRSPPIGEDGRPAWTAEIESATQRFGT